MERDKSELTNLNLLLGIFHAGSNLMRYAFLTHQYLDAFVFVRDLSLLWHVPVQLKESKVAFLGMLQLFLSYDS